LQLLLELTYQNFPRSVPALPGNTERTETTSSEFSDLVLVGFVDIGGDRMIFLDSLQDEKRSTLDTNNSLTLRAFDNGLNLLADWIEGEELDDLVLGKDGLGTGVVSEGLQESLVNGINTLLLAGGSQASSQHEIFGLNTSDTEGFSQTELVLGQGTGLVRAEDFDTSEGLNGGQLLDNSLFLGEISSTDSHGGGDDSWETDWHTDDGDSKGELEDGDDGVGTVE
jgi:hypothetical protein